MADTNKARASRWRMDLYIEPEDGKLLERIAEKTGESMNTHVRAALRPYLRKMARELGIKGDGR